MIEKPNNVCALHNLIEKRNEDRYSDLTKRMEADRDFICMRIDRVETKVEKLESKLENSVAVLHSRIDVLATRLNMYSGGILVLVLIAQSLFMYLISKGKI